MQKEKIDFLLYVRIQSHGIKSTCCKSEFSKIVSSLSARCSVCRKTLISQGFFLCFFLRREMQLFWLPRVSAAEPVSDGR